MAGGSPDPDRPRHGGPSKMASDRRWMPTSAWKGGAGDERGCADGGAPAMRSSMERPPVWEDKGPGATKVSIATAAYCHLTPIPRRGLGSG